MLAKNDEDLGVVQFDGGLVLFAGWGVAALVVLPALLVYRYDYWASWRKRIKQKQRARRDTNRESRSATGGGGNEDVESGAQRSGTPPPRLP